MNIQQSFVVERGTEQGQSTPAAIQTSIEALQSRLETYTAGTSPQPAFAAVYYDQLADLEFLKYEMTGDPADLQACKSSSNKSVDFGKKSTMTLPPGHSNLTQWWALQGWRLNTCYERFGVSSDLDNAIVAYEEALRLIDPESPLRPALLMNKANALCTRYEILGSDDIDESIEKAREALEAGHKSTATLRNDLSTIYLARYERKGDTNDLGEAIHLTKQAVEKSEESDPNLATRLLNLANIYQHCNSVPMIEDAISALRLAEARSSRGDTARTVQVLFRLARLHYSKYTWTKEWRDLHASMKTASDAIGLLNAEERPWPDTGALRGFLELLRTCVEEAQERSLRGEIAM